MDLNIHIERIMNYHSKFFFQNFFETPLMEKKRTPLVKKMKIFPWNLFTKLSSVKEC